MSNSLLRSKECDDRDYSTVLICNAIFSFLIYFILILAKGWIANWYNTPMIADVLPLYALGVIFSAIRAVYQTYLMRNYNYRKMFLLNFPATVISIFVGLKLAILQYGIWSVVILFISNQILLCLFYAFFSGWHTKLMFNSELFKRHFSFGYKISLASLINTFFENIYPLIIGKFYSLKLMGIYDRAFSLGNYPIAIISTVFSKISLSMFAELSDNLIVLRTRFKQMIRITFLVSIYVIACTAMVVPFFIKVFLGEQWLQSISIFNLLCLGFLLYPIHSLNLNILNVFGRSDLILKVEFFKKVIQVLLIVVFSFWGLNGIVYSFVMLSLISLVLNLFYTNKFLKYPVCIQLYDIIPIFLIGIITFAISYNLSFSIDIQLVDLLFKLTLFTILFVLAILLFNRSTLMMLKKLVYSK